MSWTCEQIEARLSDYLDGALAGTERTAFEAHVAECDERCAPLVAHVSQLLSGMHSMEQLEAPPRLVYAILDKTLGPRETATGWAAVLGWVRGMASMRFRVRSAFGCGYICDFAERGGLLLAQTEAGRFAADEYLSQRGSAGASGLCEDHKVRERPASGIGNSIALAAGQRSAGESGERGTVIFSRETAGPDRWLEAFVAAAAESGR